MKLKLLKEIIQGENDTPIKMLNYIKDLIHFKCIVYIE